MAIGLTFDEYFELKLMPLKRGDRVFRLATEQKRDKMFPLETAAAAGHLGSRGYACRPGTLETLVQQRVIVPEEPGRWTRADVDAAADYFEQCELFAPYAEMCRVLGCTYGDFYRALREAAEQASETYGREVRVDDQLLILHDGNYSEVARQMGVAEGTVRYRIKHLAPKLLAAGFDPFGLKEEERERND